ncbi:hypothetical protein D1007_30255 [Hordeum vulgare]|nr:hypothetical protein D1007_30255 [Hordeum vulgare]
MQGGGLREGELHGDDGAAGVQIAWCALDLKFPREETETDWSDWSDGDAQVLDVEDKDCTGKPYPASKAKEIDREWIHRHADRMGEYWDMCGDILYREDDDDTPLPPFPLKLFPPIIALCALDAKCYHCVYKTHDTSTNICSSINSGISRATRDATVIFYEVIKLCALLSYAGQAKGDEQQGLADDAGVESAATTGPIKHTNEDDTKAPYSVRSNFFIHACS